MKRIAWTSAVYPLGLTVKPLIVSLVLYYCICTPKCAFEIPFYSIFAFDLAVRFIVARLLFFGFLFAHPYF